jgi:ketosteroid isomerase-like protein
VSENVDLVRSIFADLLKSPRSWTGRARLTEANRDFLSLWTDWRIHAEGFRELDDERVLVLTRRGGRGKASGLEIWEPSANVLHVRDGTVTRLVFYWDRDRALADLGLT